MKIMGVEVNDITESYAKDFYKNLTHFIESVMSYDGWEELYEDLKAINEEHEKEIYEMRKKVK